MVEKRETSIGAHAILVNSENKVILQQRDETPGIMYPGRISMFGGTLEKGETPEEGLRRELKEELELDANDFEVKKLGVYKKTKEMDGINFTIHVYLVEPIDLEDVNLKEGAGFYMAFASEAVENGKITRITQLVLKDYIEQYEQKRKRKV